MKYKKFIEGRPCEVCGSLKDRERAHLIAESELPFRHPWHSKTGNHIAVLCRWCHRALDVYLNPRWAQYHKVPFDKIHKWVTETKPAGYRRLFLRRAKLKIILLEQGHRVA